MDDDEFKDEISIRGAWNLLMLASGCLSEFKFTDERANAFKIQLQARIIKWCLDAVEEREK